MYEVELGGFDKLIEAIDAMPRRVIPLAEKAMRRALLAVEGRAKEIPPAGPGNQQGRMDANGEPLPYYERNRGEWWPDRQTHALYGKSRGYIKLNKKTGAALGIVGYKLGKASEQLSKNFSHEVTTNDEGVEGTISNKASYFPQVIGMQQTALFEKIGWPKINKVIEASQDDINAAFDEVLNQLGEEWSKS